MFDNGLTYPMYICLLWATENCIMELQGSEYTLYRGRYGTGNAARARSWKRRTMGPAISRSLCSLAGGI